MFVQVKFKREPDHRIYGSISYDELSRRKIVFIRGYHPQLYDQWKGPLPEDNQEWICRVCRDTKPGCPDKGALVVQLKYPATTEELWEVDCLNGTVIVIRYERWGLKIRSADMWEVSTESHILPQWPTQVIWEVDGLLRYISACTGQTA